MSIVVIGDLILDDYRFVDVSRVSPEAPCLIGLDKSQDLRLGGAANVACNIRQLTNNLLLVGQCEENEYRPLLDKYDVDCKILDGKHSIKMRFIDERTNVQLFRYDIEKVIPQNSRDNFTNYVDFVDKIDFKSFNICVIVDYKKGMIRTCDIKRLSGSKINIVSTKNERPHLVLPRPRHWKRLKNAPVNILIFNNKEYNAAKEIWGYNYIIRTEGDRGMTIFKVIEDPEEIDHREDVLAKIDAIKVDIFDVTGAGDTVTAVVAFCLDKYGFSEENLVKACRCANYAASKVVTISGTAVVQDSVDEISVMFEGVNEDKRKEIKDDSEKLGK